MEVFKTVRRGFASMSSDKQREIARRADARRTKKAQRTNGRPMRRALRVVRAVKSAEAGVDACPESPTVMIRRPWARFPDSSRMRLVS